MRVALRMLHRLRRLRSVRCDNKTPNAGLWSVGRPLSWDTWQKQAWFPLRAIQALLPSLTGGFSFDAIIAEGQMVCGDLRGLFATIEGAQQAVVSNQPILSLGSCREES
jgi:hypothetical protein